MKSSEKNKKEENLKLTREEVAAVKAVIWKYFTPYLADQVLKGYGLRPGEPELDCWPWSDRKEASVENQKKAEKALADCIRKIGKPDVDRYLTEEEKALVFYSGYIGEGCRPPSKTGPPAHIIKELEKREREFKKSKRRKHAS